ncbi:tetratricopeptide repeat protein [Acetobacter oryzifermentans]|uniref:tetratricopeptide repeat protein n=1 Tax=Acetobacter oryzifermentans TaxID=1633874 RepID=UPI0039BFF7B3
MHHPALFGWLNTHVMRKTRSSACRRSGFLFAGICAIHMGLPATGWTQPTTPPAPPPAHAASQHSSSIAEQIKQLSTALAHAKTPEEAHTLQEQLEALRSAKLSPTTQLLVRRAEKDLTTDKPDDTVEDIGDALALQPDQAILWRTRAQMRLVAGDLKGAIADIGEALQRDPLDAESWSLLTSVEEHRNDGTAALKAWQKVLELSPMTDRNHKRLDALHIKAYGQPT